MQPFHGKAIALDVDHQRAPLPLLFLVHEYKVRGKNPFQPTGDLRLEVTDGWQEWLVQDGVVNEKDDGTFTFNRDAPTSGPAPGPYMRLQTSSTTAGPSGSQTSIMPPAADLVEELLAFQRTMPSWKGWQKEGMGWERTAEENTKKYVENIGVEESAE